MKNLKILLKNSVNSTLGALQGKKQRKKTGAVVAIIILAIIGICAFFALQTFGLFSTMSKLGLGIVPVFNSVQVMLMIVLLIAFQNVTAKTKTEDSDLLLSLPITKFEIVLSKTLSKLLFDVTLLLMVAVPTIVLFSIYIGFSFSFIMWTLYIVLMLSFLGVGVNYLVEYVITKLFSKTRFSEALKIGFSILAYLAFMALYMFNSFNMGKTTVLTVDAMLNRNPVMAWCARLMVENSMINFLWITLLCIPLFFLSVFLFSTVFGKHVSRRSKINSVVKYDKKTSVFSSLVKKELKNYITTPIYIMNTVLGPIMILALTVFLCIKGEGWVLGLFGGIINANYILPIIVIVMLFMSAMTQISCCSISLEGKYLWLLRANPVDEKKVLVAKSMLNMIVFLPVHIICSVVLCAVFNASAFEWVMMLTLPALSNISLAFGGTYINLLLPKLEWENESQVVKSSMSVFVAMLAGMVIAAIPLILKLAKLSITLCGYISLGLFMLITVGIIILLLTDGVKKFNNLKFR